MTDAKPPTVEELVREAQEAVCEAPDPALWPRCEGWHGYCEGAHAAIDALAARVSELEHDAKVAEINQNEADECAAELFGLVCAVIDGKPESAEAREALQRHIDHVRACRKGSCDTELHGSRLRKERDEARGERDEARRAGGAVIAACSREHPENARLREALEDIAFSPDCPKCSANIALREGREGKG